MGVRNEHVSDREEEDGREGAMIRAEFQVEPLFCSLSICP